MADEQIAEGRLLRAALLVIDGPDEGQRFTLMPGQAVTMGRGLDNTAVLSDKSVSRAHVEFTADARGLSAKDLGSNNGTLLNGSVIVAPTYLRQHDHVEIGFTVLRVELVREESTQPPTKVFTPPVVDPLPATVQSAPPVMPRPPTAPPPTGARSAGSSAAVLTPTAVVPVPRVAPVTNAPPRTAGTIPIPMPSPPPGVAGVGAGSGSAGASGARDAAAKEVTVMRPRPPAPASLPVPVAAIAPSPAEPPVITPTPIPATLPAPALMPAPAPTPAPIPVSVPEPYAKPQRAKTDLDSLLDLAASEPATPAAADLLVDPNDATPVPSLGAGSGVPWLAVLAVLAIFGGAVYLITAAKKPRANAGEKDAPTGVRVGLAQGGGEPSRGSAANPGDAVTAAQASEAQQRAIALYAKREFAGAVRALSGIRDAKTAEMHGDFVRIAGLVDNMTASGAKDPVAAFAALLEARGVDKRYGAAHSRWFDEQALQMNYQALGRDLLVKQRYEDARALADILMISRAKDPATIQLLQALEQKAGELVKRSRGAKPAEARALLEHARALAGTNSEAYREATKRLSQL